MYTQCPDCLTVFLLEPVMLGRGRGSARCSHCGAVFDALRTLAETLPPEPFEHLQVHEDEGRAPQLEVSVYRPTLEDSELKPSEAEATPEFVRRAPRQRSHHGRWIAGCAVLALTLGAQLAWAKRGTLVSDPTLRPWLSRSCALLGCRLPAIQDLKQLTLVSRDVRRHPSVPDALIISATLRNDAPFTQPFPVIQITLSNLDDQRVAMRRFRPPEYIQEVDTLHRGLPPGGNAALVFEVHDPGNNAVAFEFEFQ